VVNGVENPGLRTLTGFLEQVHRHAPVNFSTLSEERRRGYGMVSRYLKFCLGRGLITVVSERRTRGRYPSKEYALSERGLRLLNVLEETEH
jgi:DNA-binding PadR family transcriptional regulator